MKVADEQVWSETVKEIREKGERGEEFLKFFNFWADATQKMWDENYSSIEVCLWNSFVLAEEEFGSILLSDAAQMLVLFTSHWTLRDQLFDHLSPLEQKLVIETIGAVIEDLQLRAESEVQDQIVSSE